MKEIILQKSSNKDKKYDAFVDGKKVSFGSASYQDYTQHKDEDRKKSYMARHKGMGQNWNDLKTAGAWAKNLLGTSPPFQHL